MIYLAVSSERFFVSEQAMWEVLRLCSISELGSMY
jgi:hypothetical protein